jgi:hypothetical protein
MERIARNPALSLFGAVLVAVIAMTLVATKDMTFFQDTWALLIERHEITAHTVFYPHNEHIYVIPILFEQIFLRVFGMGSATPEYVVMAILLAGVAAVLFAYVRRRLGDWPALFAAVLVLGLGPAWDVLLWPFEIGLVGAILFGIAALLALERADRGGDLAATACLVVAIGFSDLGIPFAIGVAVAVLQDPRRDWRRRSYVFLVPAALYAIWWLGYGHEAASHLSLHNTLVVPRYVAESLASAVGSLFGLGTAPIPTIPDLGWGRALLVGLVVTFGFAIYRRGRASPRVWPAVAVALSNWVLTGLNYIPGREPFASRYQYAGGILVLMVLANLLEEVRWGWRGVSFIAVVTVVAVAPNLVMLKEGRDHLDEQAVITRTDTAALEIARRTVAPGFELTADVAGTPSLVNVYAGPYQEISEAYGSPAYSGSELATATAIGRRQADVVLANALPIELERAANAGAAGSCARLGVVGGRPEATVGPGSTIIQTPRGTEAQITLRRFAGPGEYPVSLGSTPGGSRMFLRIPRDESNRPWRLHVEASRPVRVCRTVTQ